MSFHRIITLGATLTLTLATACTLELGPADDDGNAGGGGDTGTVGVGGDDGTGGSDGQGGMDEMPLPDVASVSLIGVTPAEDFAQSGLVTFTLLPKDAMGEAIVDDRLAVAAPAPAGLGTTIEEKTIRAPEEGETVSTFINLDSSGSMSSNDPNELRKDAASQFVNALALDDLVAVGDFGTSPTAPFTQTRLLTDFTTDRLMIDDAIAQVTAAGGTPMYASLLEVIDYYETSGPMNVSRSILLLGDGKPGGTGTLDDVCLSAQAAQIPLNTIGLGPAADGSPSADPDAVKVLRDLADCSGGAYTGVVDAQDLGTAFDAFGQATRSGAVVVTVRFSPVPAAGETVSGDLSVASPDQANGPTVTYSFVAP